ncbi:MAG: SUMF1/EgtB/PvdO family nonheme iron enzyme, partial [Chloroflexota bacterium]
LTLPAFAMAKYPITYSQYEAFVNAPDGLSDTRWWEELEQTQPDLGNQMWKINNHPREMVNWYDSISFCRWLSWKLGSGYAVDDIGSWLMRLPTEFEWEKAARGTDGLKYPYGNNFDKDKSNTKESGINQTTPVTQYPQGASPYGVLDMSGNVFEWCLTAPDNLQQDARKENMRSDSSRVLRGGSWSDDHLNARAAARVHFNPLYRDNLFGFRLCRPPSL